MKLKNIFKHIKLVLKHKWIVFKLCCKVGIPWRGFMHDWSKFSIEEFWESIKYYDGHKSPIVVCKKENGYSKAWLHHKGRNKHHPEYWIDMSLPEKTVIMPFLHLIAIYLFMVIPIQRNIIMLIWTVNYLDREQNHYMI